MKNDNHNYNIFPGSEQSLCSYEGRTGTPQVEGRGVEGRELQECQEIMMIF
jgi:hypothetical protein